MLMLLVHWFMLAMRRTSCSRPRWVLSASSTCPGNPLDASSSAAPLTVSGFSRLLGRIICRTISQVVGPASMGFGGFNAHS